MARQFAFFVLVLSTAAALPGCGVKPVSGGTAGMLHAGGDLMSDIQVTVHQVDASATRPVGFAVTAADGTFQLLTNGARGALWLSPGEYRFTLESAGAPGQLPGAFAQADTTPLKVSWSASDSNLDLDLAAAEPGR